MSNVIQANFLITLIFSSLTNRSTKMQDVTKHDLRILPVKNKW